MWLCFYDMARMGTFIGTLGRLVVAMGWGELEVRVKEYRVSF